AGGVRERVDRLHDVVEDVVVQGGGGLGRRVGNVTRHAEGLHNLGAAAQGVVSIAGRDAAGIGGQQHMAGFVVIGVSGAAVGAVGGLGDTATLVERVVSVVRAVASWVVDITHVAGGV